VDGQDDDALIDRLARAYAVAAQKCHGELVADEQERQKMLGAKETMMDARTYGAVNALGRNNDG
jgi:hypothetical protein